MRTWEVRRATGRGFLEDEPVAAYKDLDEDGFEDLKTLHIPRHVGKLEEFLVLGPLLDKRAPVEEDFATLSACWQGQPLAPGTVYCVILEWTERQSQAPVFQALHQALVHNADGFVSSSQNAFRARGSRSPAATDPGSIHTLRRSNDGVRPRRSLRG